VEGGDGSVVATPHITRPTNRLLVPTHMNLDPEDLPRHIASLTNTAATQLGWTSATLLFVTLEPQLIEGHRYVVCGFALLQGPDAAGDAEPVRDDDEAIALVTEWHQASTMGQDLANVHPAISLALTRQMNRREELSARWLADEPQRLALAAQRHEAATRARDLLRSCLDPTQQADLDSTGAFTVVTPIGRFRVEPRHAHNVLALPPESDPCQEPTTSHCAVTSSWVPLHDQMLAQKLALDHNPTAFLAIANRAVLRPDSRAALERLDQYMQMQQALERVVREPPPPA
jgi:hypothetical protein